MPTDRTGDLGRTRPLDGEAGGAACGDPHAGAATGEASQQDMEVHALALRGEPLDAHLRRAGRPRPVLEGGRFALRGLEGVGATSRVYRVFDRNLKREVAVKVLARAAPDDDDIDSFVAEARVTAELQHPNVLPVYDLDAGDTGEVYFSMKRIVGRSLGDALGRIEAGEADAEFRGADAANSLVNVFIGVCQALSYAHHHGIIHQDVKPDNIMLGGFGEVLLVDWGSAVRLDDPSPRLYGTPLYMSPEQARRERSTPGSDVFAVGASLFHALVGRPPTSADSYEDLFRRRAAGELDAPTASERAAVPPALLRIALKALSGAPGERYSSADALLADLKAFQGGLAVSAFPEPPWRVAWRWYRRNRRACLAGLLASALIAFLLAVVLGDRAKRHAPWVLVADEDFASASFADLQQRWVGRVKIANAAKERFKDEPLEANAHWRLDGGRLRLASEVEFVDLVWRGSLAGDFRVEWDYKPERSNLDLNCFIGSDRESGFTFHIGPSEDPREARLTRGSETCTERRLEEPLQQGRVYAFMLERVGDRLRLDIDGRRIFEYTDTDPLSLRPTDTFGFDCYAGRVSSIGRVRVYDRPLPELVTPLAVGQSLYQEGAYASAERRFAQLERTHADPEVAAAASFWRARSLLRAGKQADGIALLRACVAGNPDDAMTPIALAELEAQSRAASDHEETARLRQALVRWRGHSSLRSVLWAMSEERLPLLRPEEVTEIGGRSYRDDIEVRIDGAMRDLRVWAEAYGLPDAGMRFPRLAQDLLLRLGRFDAARALMVETSAQYAKLLHVTGDYRSVLERFGHVPVARSRALFELRRYQELIADPAALDEDRASALIELGRLDEAVQRFPTSLAASYAFVAQRPVEEYERLVGSRILDVSRRNAFQTPRYRAMLARQEYERILAEYDHPICQAEALMRLGRYDELMRRFPAEPAILYEAAYRMLAAGDAGGGLELLRRLGACQPDGNAENWAIHLLVQALLPGLAGGRVDPAQALAPVLEQRRLWYGQRLWYMAALIAGRIDEAEFRRQPRQRGLEHDLQLALALREDCLGRARTAIASYVAAAAQTEIVRSDVRFIGWRLVALGGPPLRSLDP